MTDSERNQGNNTFGIALNNIKYLGGNSNKATERLV